MAHEETQGQLQTFGVSTERSPQPNSPLRMSANTTEGTPENKEPQRQREEPTKPDRVSRSTVRRCRVDAYHLSGRIAPARSYSQCPASSTSPRRHRPGPTTLGAPVLNPLPRKTAWEIPNPGTPRSNRLFVSHKKHYQSGPSAHPPGIRSAHDSNGTSDTT